MRPHTRMTRRWRIVAFVTLAGLVAVSCGGDDDDQAEEKATTTEAADEETTTTEAEEEETTTTEAEEEETTTTEAEEEETTTTEAPEAGEEFGQWAAAATATSEYGEDDWSAEQAAGAPDTPECGDYTTAWASETGSAIDTLTLTYDQPVIPSVVNVWMSYNPNQVTEIKVAGGGEEAVVYTGDPVADDSCPLTLGAMADDVDFPVDTVMVTLDESQLGLGWTEIDAVELIGVAI